MDLPRLHMPDKGNPYYNTKSVGGYSPCALGNPAARVEGLNVLPNCVGYAVGRFNELGEYGRIKWLAARGNACDFVKIAHEQGLEVTDEPTVGGVMVWTGGSGGFGHVAFVEGKATNSDGFVCSESEYYGQAWTLYTRKRGTDRQWRAGCYWMGPSFKYAGCIKNPAIKEPEKMTYEQFKKFMARWLDELKEAPADAWAVPFIRACIDAGIMTGDDKDRPFETFRPQEYAKRQELATVANALHVEIATAIGGKKTQKDTE